MLEIKEKFENLTKNERAILEDLKDHPIFNNIFTSPEFSIETLFNDSNFQFRFFKDVDDFTGCFETDEELYDWVEDQKRISVGYNEFDCFYGYLIVTETEY